MDEHSKIVLYRVNEFLRNPDLCDKTRQTVESLLSVIDSLQDQLKAKDGEIEGLHWELEEADDEKNALQQEVDELKENRGVA